MRKYVHALLLLLLVCSNSVLHAQNIDLQTKTTISANSMLLSEVLNQISSKYGVYFSYNSKQINVRQKITLQVVNRPLSEVLDKLFGSLSIQYVLVDKQIILQPAKVDVSKKTAPLTEYYTLSGYLTDSITGEVIIGGEVSVQNRNTGTRSNPYGFYSLTLPRGDYIVQYQNNGYQRQQSNVKLQQSARYDRRLQLDSALNTLRPKDSISIITPKQQTTILDTSEASNISVIIDTKLLLPVALSKRLVKQLVNFVHTTDFITTIKQQSGVSMQGDGSVFFSVRGGQKDQNLVLIDDAPVYNPAHLFGFFSSISPEAINDVQFYSADIPVYLGGSLSSVTDIKTNEGNMNRYSVFGNINLLMSSLSVEGPIIKNKCSFTTTYQKSYFAPLLGRLAPNYSADFYDYTAKINADIGKRDRLFLSFYSSKDIVARDIANSDQFAVAWKNTAISLRWNHVFGSKLFANLTLLGSRYDYWLYVSLQKNRYATSDIRNGTIKYDYTWYLNPRNTLRFGLLSAQHVFEAERVRNANTNAGRVYEKKARENVLYVGNEQQINNRWLLQYGVRLIGWSNTGQKYEIKGDSTVLQIDSVLAQGRYVTPEIRTSIQYDVTERISLRLAYNRLYQNIHLISNSISPFTTIEMRLPSTPNIAPESADQLSFGCFTDANDAYGWYFSADVYYRRLANQIDYKPHIRLFLNPLVETELLFGTTSAYGIEFNARYKREHWTGAIAYTLSRTQSQFDEINNGKPFAADTDRPHNVHLNLAYYNGKRFTATADWTLMSGNPFTSPVGFYEYNGYTVPLYGDRNNSRLPAYHRLDVSFSYRLNKHEQSRYTHHVTLSIVNAYGHKNPISINFNKIENINGKYVIPADITTDNQIVPTSLSVLGFFPNISYYFRWK